MAPDRTCFFFLRLLEGSTRMLLSSAGRGSGELLARARLWAILLPGVVGRFSRWRDEMVGRLNELSRDVLMV